MKRISGIFEYTNNDRDVVNPQHHPKYQPYSIAEVTKTRQGLSWQNILYARK
jgi:hypothetical protein